MKRFKVAAVLDHHFEQCSEEKLNNESSCFIQFRPSSGQDVGGLVARPRLKVLGRRLRMHATEKTQVSEFIFHALPLQDW